MRRALLLLLGAPGSLSFLLPSPATIPLLQQPAGVAAPRSSGKSSGSGTGPLTSSYYDEYDAQKARNMEQDRCVLSLIGSESSTWSGVAYTINRLSTPPRSINGLFGTKPSTNSSTFT